VHAASSRCRRFQRQRFGQPDELCGRRRHRRRSGTGAARLAERGTASRGADFVFRPHATTPTTDTTGKSDPNITYGYCAQVAEVEVDLETGHVQVLRLVSVDDAAVLSTLDQVEGQIRGAVARSVGWTLLENYVRRDGHALTQHPEHLSDRRRSGRADSCRAGHPRVS
jgi:CO/xanthine dehydrogenase Mo-binding subunit